VITDVIEEVERVVMLKKAELPQIKYNFSVAETVDIAIGFR
jgi:hypothetical protein